MTLAWLAIANPMAGKPREAERAGEALLRAGLVQSLVVGAGPGDGVRQAAQAGDYDGVVAIGGDGTIAEILAGLDLRRQRLSVVPVGHGNCLARDLGIGRPLAATHALRGGRVEAIDLLRVRIVRTDGSEHTWWVASTLGIGYVADVVDLGRRRYEALGRHAYAVASVCTRSRRLFGRLTVDARRQDLDSFTGVVINNTAHLANFLAFPAAALDDGVLDVMVQDCGWGRQMLHNAAVVSASAAFGPARLLRGHRVSLESERPFTLMADGELLPGVVSLEAECVPAALQCIVRAT